MPNVLYRGNVLYMTSTESSTMTDTPTPTCPLHGAGCPMWPSLGADK